MHRPGLFRVCSPYLPEEMTTMNSPYSTPADVEDAYYDAIDECDLTRMMALWDDGDDTACLLPMQPLQQGKAAIEKAWGQLLKPEMGIDIAIKHLQWIETDTLAIHMVEEQVTINANGQKQPPIYATNIYRKGHDGWRILVHLNAPAPPPPGMVNNGMLGL